MHLCSFKLSITFKLYAFAQCDNVVILAPTEHDVTIYVVYSGLWAFFKALVLEFHFLLSEGVTYIKFMSNNKCICICQLRQTGNRVKERGM